MNEVLTLDNLTGVFQPGAISLSPQPLVEEKIIEDKFLLLKKDIGEDLFNKLTYGQQAFIVNVSNTIDLGETVDIDAIYSGIEKLEYE
ncbi:MAG: hypothetical protein HYW65_02870 [Candidatus Liptonbacteria bacterium]|nr:hypothetical protein [Candidatus Liptonbacteria bacterium]